jgi:prepilin-type N-terminal cleavage/methylation domain-containing protein
MRTHSKAFTLIEVIVAISIFAVVMISVFEIYFGALSLNRRLEFARSLQENARSMTEMFAKEVRERGVDLAFYDGGSASRTLDYQRGNSVLAIRPDALGNSARYYLMEDSVSGPVACADTGSGGCYLGRESIATDGTSERVRITDSRVKVERLRFHIVGSSADSVAS